MSAPPQPLDPISPGSPEPPLIGWREWLALPALGIPAIKAKVDTGARTSALHTFRTERVFRHGRALLDFSVHPLQRRGDVVVSCTAPLLDQRLVRDSGGHLERRHVVETRLRLGDVEWTVELTLTDRDPMLFRMLLGRTAMAGLWRIDPGASYLVGARPNLGRLYGVRPRPRRPAPPGVLP